MNDMFGDAKSSRRPPTAGGSSSSRGIAWLVFALIVFQWDYTTVYAISILFGIVAIFAGVNEFMEISVSTTGWKWVHAILGVLFVLVGIYALVHPYDTFSTLAALVGFFLLFKGIFDITVAFMTKDEFELWWLQLVLGLARDPARVLGRRELPQGGDPARGLRRASSPSCAGSARSSSPSSSRGCAGGWRRPPDAACIGRAACIGSPRCAARLSSSSFSSPLSVSSPPDAAARRSRPPRRRRSRATSRPRRPRRRPPRPRRRRRRPPRRRDRDHRDGDRDDRASGRRRSRRGQGGLPRSVGVRHVPHARRRRHLGRRRPEPRRRAAERRARRRPCHERAGRDAGLLEHAQRAADRRRRGVRLVGRRSSAPRHREACA